MRSAVLVWQASAISRVPAVQRADDGLRPTGIRHQGADTVVIEEKAIDGGQLCISLLLFPHRPLPGEAAPAWSMRGAPHAWHRATPLSRIHADAWRSF